MQMCEELSHASVFVYLCVCVNLKTEREKRLTMFACTRTQNAHQQPPSTLHVRTDCLCIRVLEIPLGFLAADCCRRTAAVVGLSHA